MRDHWKQDLGVGAALTVIAWLGLFGLSLVDTLYKDHKTTTAAASNLQQERDNARNERDSLRLENTALQQAIKANMVTGKLNSHISNSNGPETKFNAPNGIAIGGNNLGSAAVNNTFSDVYPRPGIIPEVNFCISQPQISGGEYVTSLEITTNTEITSPFWALFFDQPATEAIVEMDGPNHEPFAWSDGHPYQSGLKTQPLTSLPVESRVFPGEVVADGVNTDNILKIQITQIGPPFSGPYRPWGPKDNLKVTVKSPQPARLITIASGSGRSFLAEHMTIGCAK